MNRSWGRACAAISAVALLAGGLTVVSGSPAWSYLPPDFTWNSEEMAWEWTDTCTYQTGAQGSQEELCKQAKRWAPNRGPTMEGVTLMGLSNCSPSMPAYDKNGPLGYEVTTCDASWKWPQPDGPLYYTRSWGSDKGQDRNRIISFCEENLQIWGGSATLADPVTGYNILLPEDAVLVAASSRRIAEEEKRSPDWKGDFIETICTYSTNPNAVPVKKPQSSASGSVANSWGPPVEVANRDDSVSIVITSLTSSIGAVVSGELPYGSYTIEVSSSLGHDVALSANGGGCTVKGTRLEVVKVDSTCRVEAVTTDGAGGSFSDVFEAKTVLGTQGMAFNWPTVKKQKVGKSLTLAKKNQRETSAGQTIKFSITKGKGNCTVTEAKNKSIKLKITKKGPCRVEAKAKAIKGKYKAASKKQAYQGV